jgi:thioesterase domain-containing protein
VNLPDFLADLQSREIQLWADGGRLRCSGPVGVLTPELRDQLQQRKDEILEFLRAAEAIAQQQTAIVPLQPDGGRVPVFAVAGHNGDVFAYRALAQHLGDEQPFFGLRPPGLDGHTEPITRIEDLAAYFVGQILTFRPKGPIIVAGYCAGGSIAFELAQQLERRGARVILVALFGCPYPTMYRFMTARFIASRVLTHAKAFAALSSFGARRQYLAGLWTLLGKELRASRSERTETDAVSAMRIRLEKATIAALRHYVPARFSGRISLFMPNRKWLRSVAKPLRWQSQAVYSEKYFGPDDCEVDNMLHVPAVSAIAELFKQACDRNGMS